MQTCSVRICTDKRFTAVIQIETPELKSDDVMQVIVIPARSLTFTYLIQSIVGGDGDGVGVHHQPLSQQREQTVCVHDLNFSPAGKQTHICKGFMTAETDTDCH